MRQCRIARNHRGSAQEGISMIWEVYRGRIFCKGNCYGSCQKFRQFEKRKAFVLVGRGLTPEGHFCFSELSNCWIGIILTLSTTGRRNLGQIGNGGGRSAATLKLYILMIFLCFNSKIEVQDAWWAYAMCKNTLHAMVYNIGLNSVSSRRRFRETKIKYNEVPKIFSENTYYLNQCKLG